MEIPQAVRAAHRDLSPIANRFLDYALTIPEMREQLEVKNADVPDWVRGYRYDLQSWPVFIGDEMLNKISRATAGVTRLARSIPERIFNNDADRIAKFYGWESAALTSLLLASPNGLDTALARCDLISSEKGLKCVEINGGAGLGGWEQGFLEPTCRRNAQIKQFLVAENCGRPSYRDPFYAAMSHIVKTILDAGIARDGELNIALVFEWDEAREFFSWQRSFVDEMQSSFNVVYGEVLEDTAPGLRGQVLCCTRYEEIISRGMSLALVGRPVHAVVEASPFQTPRDVFRCFKAGTVGLYNGPIGTLLGDKRNLAILSQLEDSDLLTAEERELVREHVPWSRVVSDCRTSWRGESVSLLDFARANRESLVLKPSGGNAGIGVHVGSQTSPEEWSARLDGAAASRSSFILQELVRSRPYLFPYGPAYAEHDLVWGTFCFGDEYGGGFIRMMPLEHGPCVINSARGATGAFMYELG